jgi:hypothetical protein
MTRYLERNDEHENDHRQDQLPPGSNNGNLRQLRRESQEILAAGDEAIERALSDDSATFLLQARQHGGQ